MTEHSNKRTWLENKFVITMLTLVLTGLLAWGVWVTRGAYSGENVKDKLTTVCSQVDEAKKDIGTLKLSQEKITTIQEKITGVCSDIDDMKKDVGSLKTKIDVQAVKFDVQILKAESNQAEMLKMQREIMTELRRK